MTCSFDILNAAFYTFYLIPFSHFPFFYFSTNIFSDFYLNVLHSYISAILHFPFSVAFSDIDLKSDKFYGYKSLKMPTILRFRFDIFN